MVAATSKHWLKDRRPALGQRTREVVGAAVERTERGETVAVLAHGRQVADVVPSAEIERLRETIDVLPDSDLLRELRSGLDDLRAGRVLPTADVAADLRRRSQR